jgi:hypothetical protein
LFQDLVDEVYLLRFCDSGRRPSVRGSGGNGVIDENRLMTEILKTEVTKIKYLSKEEDAKKKK